MLAVRARSVDCQANQSAAVRAFSGEPGGLLYVRCE